MIKENDNERSCRLLFRGLPSGGRSAAAVVVGILGSETPLGIELQSVLRGRGLPWVPWIPSGSWLDQLVRQDRVEPWLVNCGEGRQGGEWGPPANLERTTQAALWAQRHGVQFIQMSSDRVFGGQGLRDEAGSLRPYQEHDPASPEDWYGKLKFEEEAVVRRCCPQAWTLRVTWPYGLIGTSVLGTVLRSLRCQTEWRVPASGLGTPTAWGDVAHWVADLIEAHPAGPGVVHVSPRGWTSWLDLAGLVLERGRALGLLDHDVTLVPGSEPPERTWSVLSTQKLEEITGRKPPHWSSAVEGFLQNLA